MRLDRYLSSASVMTRSQAQKAIRKGRVRVNGGVANRPAAIVPAEAEVSLDGQLLARSGLRYFMLNKPQGYVCSTDDQHNSSVLELLDEPVLAGLHFAGRLDIDTTGLVLITDDGEWSHRITAPRRKRPKIYLVTLAEPLSEESADRLKGGLLLRNEKDPTRPAELERLTETLIRLSITEGRYHQVKRMMAAVGNRVIALHREAVASLMLDADLQPGQYRALTALEIASAVQD
ncbi:MAG: 16S rRNA pseudouridine(516) synthase RsuA [Pseudomonadota bacterium]